MKLIFWVAFTVWASPAMAGFSDYSFQGPLYPPLIEVDSEGNAQGKVAEVIVEIGRRLHLKNTKFVVYPIKRSTVEFVNSDK